MKRAAKTNLKRWRTYGAPTRIRAEKKRVDSYGNSIHRESIHTVASVLPLNRSRSIMKTVTALTIGVILLSVFSFLFLVDSTATVRSSGETSQPTPPSSKGIKKTVSPTPICSPERTPRPDNDNRIRELDADDALDGGLGTSDSDCDRVCNVADNCISVYNPDQADTDGDGKGDACRIQLTNPNFVDSRCDEDGDGVPDTKDNCPSVCNPGQKIVDRNKNGVNDLCDGFSPKFVFERFCTKRIKVKAPTLPKPDSSGVEK